VVSNWKPPFGNEHQPRHARMLQQQSAISRFFRG
jgi:hypothetical protein